MTASNPIVICTSDQLDKSEVSKTPLLKFDDLQEALRELRETLYLLDYQFFIKGYNSGTAR